MINKINELIEMLNPENDMLLILSLKEKVRQINQIYLSEHEVSEIEIIYAKRGFEKTINKWVDDDCNQNVIIFKINKILKSSRDCETCKNRIPFIEYHRGEKFTGWVLNSENPKCISCTSWIDKLHEKLKIEEKKERAKYEVEIPLDFYKSKALIQKIQNKIRTIKQKSL